MRVSLRKLSLTIIAIQVGGKCNGENIHGGFQTCKIRENFLLYGTILEVGAPGDEVQLVRWDEV